MTYLQVDAPASATSLPLPLVRRAWAPLCHSGAHVGEPARKEAKHPVSLRLRLPFGFTHYLLYCSSTLLHAVSVQATVVF